MAESTLVESLNEDGRELITDLVSSGFPMAAAWWAKVIPETTSPGDRAEWQLFLASPVVDQRGIKVAYHKVYEALRGSPRGDSILAPISLGSIKVVGVNDPITGDVSKIIKHYRGKPPIYVGRCRLGNIEAEEINIVYAAALPAPWQQVVLKTDTHLAEPLSPPERRAMSAIVASGINPVQAGLWKKNEELRPKPPVRAGTIVNARIILGKEDDPDPLLLFTLPDGRQGITHKSNTEPAPAPG